MTWDNFFYYGLDSTATENEKELYELLMQPIKSLSYYRNYGIDHKYNYPMAAFNQILLAFSIVKAVAYRNQEVSDGSVNPDRRIAVSQQSIQINDSPNGERNFNIYYFNYFDYQNIQSINNLVV